MVFPRPVSYLYFPIIKTACVFFLLWLIVPPGWIFASSFTITADDLDLSDADSVSLTASISGLRKMTKYYFEGAFTRSLDNPHYFSLTQKTQDEWYRYESSPQTSDLTSHFFSIVTDALGNTVFTLRIKPDYADPDFKGSGNYFLRLKRFTQGGSSDWSDNSLAVILSHDLPTPTTTLVLTQHPSPTTVAKAVTKMPTLTKNQLASNANNQPSPNQDKIVLPTVRVSFSATHVKSSQSAENVLGIIDSPLTRSETRHTTSSTTLVGGDERNTDTASSALFILGGSLMVTSAALFYKKKQRKKLHELV